MPHSGIYGGDVCATSGVVTKTKRSAPPVALELSNDKFTFPATCPCGKECECSCCRLLLLGAKSNGSGRPISGPKMNNQPAGGRSKEQQARSKLERQLPESPNLIEASHHTITPSQWGHINAAALGSRAIKWP